MKVFKLGFMNPGLAQKRVPYIAKLQNVVLDTDYCALYSEDEARVYILEVSGRNLNNSPYVCAPPSPDGRFFPVELPPVTATISQPFVLLGTDGAMNYSHWLSRNVLKLSLVEAANLPISMPILLNENLAPYQVEYLDLLGIDRDRLLMVPTAICIRCSEVAVPVLLRGHPRMDTAIHWLREKVSSIMFPEESAKGKLFISRRDSSQRRLLNELEVEAELVSRGFISVVLSDYSVVEQIRLFSQAKIVVAAHGAGLTNLVFAPRGAMVVEITNTKIHHMDDFRSIAAHMGQIHCDVVSDDYPDVQPNDVLTEPQKHNFSVSVEDVLDALEKVQTRGRNDCS